MERMPAVPEIAPLAEQDALAAAAADIAELHIEAVAPGEGAAVAVRTEAAPGAERVAIAAGRHRPGQAAATEAAGLPAYKVRRSAVRPPAGLRRLKPPARHSTGNLFSKEEHRVRIADKSS